MAKDNSQLRAAKRAYWSAREVGNRREEARWANVVGDILKNRGQYVGALKWLRIDYDISSKFLPEKDLLPTCQSIGELFLRLEDFENALYYQKEHLRLAKEAKDLVEQQRASTQLGRTYHEMLLKNENDHLAIQNAKKYFKSAMDLAQTLKENPPSSKSSFLKEYIDAYNNIGLLEVELEHFEQAEKVLLRGLEICDEEEVHEDDDGRSRLHHNLGVVYTRLRMWDKAREHIRKDILICKRIGHCQGEAKGYINLGELHWQVQKYEDAMLSYQKALELAKSMQDEDALVTLIKQNMEVVDEYVRIMAEMKKEEQNLKKLKRNTAMARGMSSERKCLQQQMTSLDHLLDKSSSISAWLKHLEFAKMKKRIATELCDKEKLSDSFLAIGESYKRLRKFRKGLKWLTKSWETYKLIGNLEGQALAKINIGDALDCSGDWMGALKSFEEGYRTAVQANLPLVQVSALENMHYSHMMRFDNIDEARRLQVKINELKQLIDSETKENSAEEDCCPETESEDSSGQSNASELPENGDEPFTTHRRPFSSIEEVEDDEPLISLFHPVKRLHKQNTDWAARARTIPRTTEVSLNGLSRSTSSPLTTVGRKRTHLVLSDDEDEVDYSRWRRNSDLLEDVATSNDLRTGGNQLGLASQYLDVLPDACKCTTSSCTPVNLEESACSYKSSIPEGAADKDPESSGISKCCIGMKIEDSLIFVEAGSCIVGDEFDIEMLKVQVACSYYLQLPSEMKSNGLLPIIGHLKHRGQALAPREAVETLVSNSEGDAWVEVSISGWVQKRLIKLYVDCCKKLSEIPNMKLLKKLYNLEVSEDEVIVSDCELQDISVIPLLDALDAHKTIAMLDLSHNKLGNGTMEKLQKVFTLSGQKYGGLVLDLHNNLFGPTALFQICECPVLFSRLEVLNISGNRLTDSCGSYLSTIVENCKALYSLNMERCSVTSRTIQKVTDALGSGSVLSQLSIGYNNPVSGSSLSDLLSKLATLERFSELSLNGLKLNRPTLDSICQLSKSSCLSSLMLGATNIDSVGALQLTESLFCDAQELVKLDLSHCRLSPEYFNRLNTDALASCILELNLAGNPIMPKGGCALVSALVNPQCSIKVLTLRKCHLGLVGVIQIINALAENNSLEELNVAENIEPLEYCTCQLDSAPGRSSDATGCPREEAEAGKHEPSGVEVAFDQLQAADSYDNEMRAEPSLSALDDSCTSAGGRHALSTSNQSVMELVSAINKAKQLQLLDLSNNGFPVQVAGALYEAWSSSSRAGLPGKHIKDQTLHLSILGKRCCGVKPCCLRD